MYSKLSVFKKLSHNVPPSSNQGNKKPVVYLSPFSENFKKTEEL